MAISDYYKYRLLEIIPGFLVWGTLIGMVVFSFIKPLWMIIFIIIFDFYWLSRILYLLVFLFISFSRYKKSIKIDWLKKCEDVPEWKNMYHAIFLPTYKEDWDIVDGTFDSLINSDYPLDKMIVVFAAEERDKEDVEKIAEQVREKYEKYFNKLIVTFHPDNIPGEVKGKGANIHYAGKIVKNYVDEQNIPYQNVIVSSFDIDTCVHPQYFSYLTYHYLKHPNPTHASFQPIPLFNNNIWDSPAFMRIASFGTTFWLMTEQLRPERLFTFSSHSMSFKALVDVGFWQNDIVTEDSRIFLQCFLHYNGDYEVYPMYIPVSMDTVMGKSWWSSLENLYKQQRRWAFGVEHFPYMLWHFRKNKKIPWGKKFRYVLNLTEGFYSWATAPIMIFILGRLPLMVASPEVSSLVVVQNAPYILQWLMTAAMIGLLVSAVLSFMLLPPPPKRTHKGKYFVMVLQWLLFPISMIVFGSVPAIDAQTRMMTGKYLGFHVTEKARKK
ncbi:glycosyltransferase family 2 protein [Patescibacteria group bacterium]|nr:glycosyltransferase family 2 protein [Patescibacteria group bacterium]MBU1672901.1 glycosyltransferase family 2 protein [Patescibacteria group bacterium]MBU1963152.1 glycosyltransferase family 2 protein [Patescibacteria group bacterium]